MPEPKSVPLHDAQNEVAVVYCGSGVMVADGDVVSGALMVVAAVALPAGVLLP